jgi:hypothetical protein
MEKSVLLFEYLGGEWVSKFDDLLDNFDNKEIEISSTLMCFDKKRPEEMLMFLERKFGMKGPFSFISKQTRTQKLKEISESFKSPEDVSDKSKHISLFLRLKNRVKANLRDSACSD